MREDVLFDALAREREHLLKQVEDCPLDKRNPAEVVSQTNGWAQRHHSSKTFFASIKTV
jgi:hypothetical protein